VIASPFTKGDPLHPRVVSNVFDHTSVLKLIEWRWGLRPLTARDASNDVGNLLDALDLDRYDPAVPALPEPDSPPPNLCP
jgi:phospholipase C